MIKNVGAITVWKMIQILNKNMCSYKFMLESKSIWRS